MPLAYAVGWPKLVSHGLEDVKAEFGSRLLEACRYRLHTRCCLDAEFGEVWLRALIVDDSAGMRKGIERARGQAGLELNEVLGGATGEGALQMRRCDQSA